MAATACSTVASSRLPDELAPPRTEGTCARLAKIDVLILDAWGLHSELRAVAMRSREAVFDILFASASQTLLVLGRDPKRLGGELGVTMVLHTWTRELHFHPHGTPS